MQHYRISHLKELEAESIHIIREVASEFENPVMLYSVGKDSSVMVRLALKAFYPGKVPFPLLHVDTSYKYKEMYEFRDRFTAENNLDLVVGKNEKALPRRGQSLRPGHHHLLWPAQNPWPTRCFGRGRLRCCLRRRPPR